MKTSVLLLPLLAIALAATQATAETNLVARQLTGTNRAMDDLGLPGAPTHYPDLDTDVDSEAESESEHRSTENALRQYESQAWSEGVHLTASWLAVFRTAAVGLVLVEVW